MKKAVIGTIVAVVIIAIAGGYVALHKSSYPTAKPPTAASPTSGGSSGNSKAQSANGVVITKTNSLGQYLAEPDGTPLYTYSRDRSGVSNCTGSCLASWPAYQDKSSTTGLPADVGTIKRTDNGEVQFTYYGMPLYTFIGDSNGQVTGNGVAGFTLAKPAADTTSVSPSPLAN